MHSFRPLRLSTNLVAAAVIAAAPGTPLLPAILAVSAAVPSDVQYWSQGDPTADEQSALEWLNRSRIDPVGTFSALIAESASDSTLGACFAALAPQTPPSLLANLQSALTTAQANSAAYPHSAAISQAPLTFYPLFQSQAQVLLLSVPAPPPPAFPAGRSPPAYYPPVPIAGTLLSGPANLVSGPNATGGTADFGPFGANYADATVANLYASALTPREFALSWLCMPGSGSPPPAFLVQGDSLPDLTLGHTRMAGLALGPGASAGIQTLALYRASSEFLTQSDLPFGAAATVFITGVAYRDQNSNGRYDSGEGLAGVTLTLDHGSWAAVTATAGGYAIPVPAGGGIYTVTAQGGGFTGATASVVVASDNVECDWVLAAAAPTVPPQITVPATTGTVQLSNLSTRGLVETGSGPLVGGFVIAGPLSARKSVLIRGVGPSLQSAGIPPAECVPATQLTVYSAASPVAANAGWTSTPDAGAAVATASAQAGAFALTRWAGGGGDSAVVLSLAPGLYSAVVTPAPGAPPADAAGHIGLVEIYDLSPGDGSTLVNLSSLGLMGSGDDALVIGATVIGSGAQRLLVRAAGPALTAFGISPILGDPALTLYDASGSPEATNDDWGVSAQADQVATLAAAVGAFPFAPGSADSALLVVLSPGSYSAIVSAKPGTSSSGQALVEIYATP